MATARPLSTLQRLRPGRTVLPIAALAIPLLLWPVPAAGSPSPASSSPGSPSPGSASASRDRASAASVDRPTAGATPAARRRHHARPHRRPAKAVFRTRPARGVPTPASDSPMTYHGGPVMHGPVDVYLVWYGGWSGSRTVPVLTDLVSGLGDSSYFVLNAGFTDSSHAAAGPVRYAGSVSVGYSRGHSLSDRAVRRVVADVIGSGQLPASSSAVYAVLTSADVRETSGFTTRYCGWHTRTRLAGTDIKYAFVGDPSTQGPKVCSAQHGTTPNGDLGADAMADVLTHELDETVTDPDLDAWYDRYRNENADKCAWTYGITYKARNGATANLRINGRDYLVQRTWSLDGQRCAQSR